MTAPKKRVKRRPKKVRCAPPKPRKPAKSAKGPANHRTSAKRRQPAKGPKAAVESRRRRPAACKRRKRRPVRKPSPRGRPPAAVQPVPPAPQPSGVPDSSPTPAYTGGFGPREAERLLWRAGFGPSPGHAEALAAMGLEAAVASLTRPSGSPTLTGAEPSVDGAPLEPQDAWGHDHLWFLDRMVRTDQPLMERMALIWHDWFATSTDGASQAHLLHQNELFRRNALGSFETMAMEITTDPAMILWLDQGENRRGRINENYAREFMELFTLGADRGAYSEQDVRELARALSGWRHDWSSELGDHNFRFDASRHDTGAKTIFGQTGSYGWDHAVRLCLDSPHHASYFVEKLWGYFIPTPPSEADRRALEETYVGSGLQIRPVVEAILMHPQLYSGPRMVKPPVVYLAGLMRNRSRPIDDDGWTWVSRLAGQQLFRPPSVAGWDDERWLDTSTLRGRWVMVSVLMEDQTISSDEMKAYDALETPEQAVRRARDFWGDPAMTAEGVAALTTFATTCLPATMANWEQPYYRGLRQNALRHLLATSPDLQTS